MFLHFKSRALKCFQLCRETAPLKCKLAKENIIHYKLCISRARRMSPLPHLSAADVIFFLIKFSACFSQDSLCATAVPLML